MKRYISPLQKIITALTISLIGLILLILTAIQTNAVEYHPNIRPAFEQYQQVEQPYNAPVHKARIDWNSYNYNDPMWGWYYKQLWWLYHPNSGETPPWLIPTTPVGDGILILALLSTLYAIKICVSQKKVVPLQPETQNTPTD